MIKITSLDTYQDLKKAGEGFICIKDNTRINKVHSVSCRWINIRNLKKKIIENSCKQGEYFYSLDYQKLHLTFNAIACRNCSKVKEIKEWCT